VCCGYVESIFRVYSAYVGDVVAMLGVCAYVVGRSRSVVGMLWVCGMSVMAMLWVCCGYVVGCSVDVGVCRGYVVRMLWVCSRYVVRML